MRLVISTSLGMQAASDWVAVQELSWHNSESLSFCMYPDSGNLS